MENKKILEEKIVEFLLDPNNPESYKGYEIFKKAFIKEFNKYSLLKNYYDGEDLFNEFLTKVVFREDGFLLNKNMIEKINSQKDNFFSYLYMSIHNFLRTYNRRAKVRIISDEEQSKQRFENIYQKNEEGKEFETSYLKQEINYIVIIEAKEILKAVKKDFSEKDLRTLCYMFFDDKSYYGENISDDNAYQRKSRLKKRLADYVRKKGFSLEGFEFFIKNYLLSEICNNFR